MARKTNCKKNGKSYYRLTATLGRDSNGKVVKKEFYANSKKEAEKLRDEYLNAMNCGFPDDYKEVSLGNLMHMWIFEIIFVSNRIKPSTFERYEGIFRNYVEGSDIYHLKLHDMKSIHLQRYYNELYCKGKSSGVIKSLNKVLKTFFFYAVDEGYLLKNPCSSRKLVIPGKSDMKKRDVPVYTKEEISVLREHLKDSYMECILLMAIGTGLRQGELLGLKWSDIDFESKELQVKRTLQTLYTFDANRKKTYQHVLQPPKSKSSMRTVPIPSMLIPILKSHRISQMQEKLKAGSSYYDYDLVFSTEIGNFIDSRNLIRGYQRFINKTGLTYRKFHSLRHTYATQLFESNIPLKTIQTLLGHSDISITANIYTHVMPKERIDAVEHLNRLFV